MIQPLIDKHIPLPVRWPFPDMKIGDSFIVPTDVARSTVNVAARRYGDKHNMKFTVRLTEDRTLRCWRIE